MIQVKVFIFSILELLDNPISNIRNNYLIILEVINSLNIHFHSPNSIGRKPKMADIEVVALSLMAEFMSIDSENDLFRQISSADIPNLIKRSQFNKRRRKLFCFLKQSGWPQPQSLRSWRIISLWTACLWRSVNLHVKTG